jgi:antitoxin MazE
MSTIIRTRLVKIGNSQGVRIPKVVLEQLRMTDTIELEVQDDQLVVRSSATPRGDWAAVFQHMAALADDQLLDGDLAPSVWEETEWEW